MTEAHLMPLGDSGWFVWREALLRTTGFPADGLDLLSAPECARALESGAEDFAEVFRRARARASDEVLELVARPLLLEAITWQNPNALIAIDGLLRGGAEAPLNEKRRSREEIVARYWQRYCGKNETVGYFGPICWTRLDSALPAVVSAKPGSSLVRRRKTYLEQWALKTYGELLCADREVREWFAPMLHAHLTLDGVMVRQPARPPVELHPAEAAVVAACDGARSARAVVAELTDKGVLRQASDGFLILERLVERDLLQWDADLPINPQAEAVLERTLERIGADEPRARALAGLRRLQAARDRVSAVAGQPVELRGALADLGEEFSKLTGAAAQRRGGQMYAARGLCYEETVRDLDVTFGPAVLDAISEPLGLLLQAARWLTAELAREYSAGLRALYEELRADGEPVWLGDLWYLAQGMLFGAQHRPVDDVAAAFTARWASLFGLTGPESGASLQFRSADLAEAVAKLFPAQAPGWSLGAMSSPDLQICASDISALNRGDFFVVLSELHVAWPTFDSSIFMDVHPDPESLREAMALDLGRGRVRPLLPDTWTRTTARTSAGLDHSSDRLVGFVPAQGRQVLPLLPITSVRVHEEDGSLYATSADGSRWPLLEMFSRLVATHALDAFKVTSTNPHTPRVTIDRLVVVRETWRMTVAETGLVDVVGGQERYRAVRAWAKRLSLPDRVYTKLSSETKPCYVDLASPLYVSMFCTMIRSAAMRSGGDVGLVISEMLPTPDLAWVPDQDGRRYFSELRLQVIDPVKAEGR